MRHIQLRKQAWIVAPYAVCKGANMYVHPLPETQKSKTGSPRSALYQTALRFSLLSKTTMLDRFSSSKRESKRYHREWTLCLRQLSVYNLGRFEFWGKGLVGRKLLAVTAWMQHFMAKNVFTALYKLIKSCKISTCYMLRAMMYYCHIYLVDNILDAISYIFWTACLLNNERGSSFYKIHCLILDQRLTDCWVSFQVI